MNFKPGKLVTALTGLALIVLISLGTWQARKIGPKNDLLAAIDAGLSADPMLLPVHIDDPEPVRYRRVEFAGEALDEAPLRLYGMNLSGRPGYFLYKPVVREYGRAVMVNFGWVPMEAKELPALPVGRVTVSGVLMANAVAGSFTPPNDTVKGIWYAADVHEMAKHWGFSSKDYYHFRVFADHTGARGDLPLGGQVRVNIPNDHFEYMLTWYGIAVSLIGVYIAFGVKKVREEAESP